MPPEVIVTSLFPVLQIFSPGPFDLQSDSLSKYLIFLKSRFYFLKTFGEF